MFGKYNFFKELKILNIKGRMSFVAKAQNTIISAAFILAFSATISSFLGFIKSRLLASNFGISDQLGIFFIADRIPSLIYSILVVGAFSTVFIPVFTSLYNKNKKDAWETASAIICLVVVAFFVIATFVIIFAPSIINIITTGLLSPAEVTLGANLMRIMIAGQLILVVSSFVTSILQSFKYFIIPALAPIVYNLGMILGIVFLSSKFGIYAPAFGVIIGATFHLLIQLPQLSYADFKFSPSFVISNYTSEAFKLVPARIFSVLINQMIITINNSLAILVSTSSVVILKFASQLQFLPVALFGLSMASAALPVLSENSNQSDLPKFRKIFLTTFHQMMFLVLPASVILIILRIPVVRLVFGVQDVTWEQTVTTAYALAFFSISIFAQSGIYLISRSFYALKDTFTPVKTGVVVIIFNVGFSLFMIKGLNLGIWAVAMSYTLSVMLEMFLLIILLQKKIGKFSYNEIILPTLKIAYATLLMAFTIYIPLKLLDQYVFDTTKTLNLLVLTGIVSCIGMCVYLVFTWLFRVEEIELFYKLLRKISIKNVSSVGPHQAISQEHDHKE